MNSFFVCNDYDYSRFDELNSRNIEHMDISSLFKLENNIVNNINKMKENTKDLDIIYLNYKNLKNKIDSKINNDKELLIKINSKKDDYDKKDERKKLLFLTKEYNFFLEQTNTKELNKKISNLEKRINFLRENLKDKKLTLEYKKIKEQYKNILIFINSEKFDNKADAIPNNLNNKEKIDWYEKRIEELIEKQMIFDKYIYLLENLYNDILKKKMLDITFS